VSAGVPFLDLRRQQEAVRPEIERALAAVLDAGHYILGGEVAAFEAEFAAFAGARFAVGVASGTDALELSLIACGIGRGDEVVTVANAGAPTICAILAAGATPVLADVDPVTLTLDPASAEACITPRTRALLPVHLYGQCADMAALAALATTRGLRLIEDCAQAHGARFRGASAGSIGDTGCFSFYPTKNLGAIGDGGLVVTNDEALAASLRELRMYGESAPRHTTRPRGRNSRLDEMQAALLRVKLRRLAAWNERRRAIADAYGAAFAGLPLTLPAPNREREHVYHLYVVRSSGRDALRARLRERGVDTLIHYERPVHRHEAFRGLDPAPRALSVSERAAAEVLSLPLYPELSDAEVDTVIRAVREAC